MNSNHNRIFKKTIHLILLSGLLCIQSCKKFIEVGTPRTALVKESVFASDATAVAAITDIYFKMLYGSFANGTIVGLSYIGGLSSDDLQNYSTDGFGVELQQFNDNNILSSNSLSAEMWNETYQYIYKANAIIEGLAISSGVTQQVAKQLTGEAKFIRAFSHFYLYNLYGEIPLATTTDYKTNASAPRSPKNLIYDQIIADLTEAKDLLADDYSYSKGERGRVNRFAASALLARVYLYNEQWDLAEQESSVVIDHSTLYSLTPLEEVFLANSSEAIWQLVNPYDNTWEAGTYYFETIPTNAALTLSLVEQFEVNDLRRTFWVGSRSDGVNDYYYPNKYKAFGFPVTEYSTILRLAEQYLIRAEARARQNKILVAQEDLNTVRDRAGLVATTANNSDELVEAIIAERRKEFFTEWGHRWFDLKRTQKLDETMSPLKPAYKVTSALFPIPPAQILNDPAMRDSQNPGYD